MILIKDGTPLPHVERVAKVPVIRVKSVTKFDARQISVEFDTKGVAYL